MDRSIWSRNDQRGLRRLSKNGILSALSSADLTSNYAFAAFALMAHCSGHGSHSIRREQGLCTVFSGGGGGGGA